MSTDLSIVQLVLDASFIVQLVMLLLLLASMMSWVVIFIKWASIKRAKKDARRFEDRFWSGIELSELYKSVSARRDRLTGAESIFEAGFREFAQLRNRKGFDTMDVVHGAHRAMRVATNREIEKLEHHLSFLATVGSTSPYVGLFGTVWGIMNSFLALGNVQSASIASVAPGIAEALIATAMGLFAAIPAVISYNRYISDVERLTGHYDTFVDEFATILQRQSNNS